MFHLPSSERDKWGHGEASPKIGARGRGDPPGPANQAHLDSGARLVVGGELDGSRVHHSATMSRFTTKSDSSSKTRRRKKVIVTDNYLKWVPRVRYRKLAEKHSKMYESKKKIASNVRLTSGV